MISHLQLSTVKTLSHSSSLKQNNEGVQFVDINHPKFNATFSLHGAHLIHFQAKDNPATIWTSKTAFYNSEKAIRGGVPICWPWFGAANTAIGKGLPSHGFARTSNDWMIGDINECSESIQFSLHLYSTTETKKIWPFDFHLTLIATMSDTLKLELITENTGSTAFSYRGALHSYLNLSDVKNIQITDLATSLYNDLTEQKEHSDGNLIIDQAIDCIYEKSPKNIKLKDAGFNREISIINDGNDCEVLWSPWIEGAKAFPDMPDDGFKTMFCIESGILDKAGVTVQPKSKHTLSTTFSQKALNLIDWQ